MVTYAEAGVDVEAGDKAVELMKDSIRRAQRPEVLGGLGGFAGLFDATRLTRMTRPVLATSTDGVGTKVAIAQALDKHDTIGFDLVGMVVDDIVVCGAEPLYMTDYIATGKVVPERIAEIVGGIADACARGRHRPRRRRDRRAPGPARARTSTTSPAPPPASSSTPTCSGPHGSRPATSSSRWRPAACTPTATPWSAASSRAAGWSLDRHVDEFGRTLGEELLEPTRLYTAGLPRPHPAAGPARPRPQPRHRRRARRQPRAGAPAGHAGHRRPVHLDPAARLRDWSSAWAGCPAPTSSAPSTRASASSWSCPPTRPTAPSRTRRAPAYPPGYSASDHHRPSHAPPSELVSGAKGVDGGAVQVLGEHPDA